MGARGGETPGGLTARLLGCSWPRQGWWLDRVRLYIDRWGPYLERDLLESGIDLLDYFRGEREWEQLTRFIDTLPVRSHTLIALRDDDEFVQAQVASGAMELNSKEARISEHDYSPESARLDRVTDQLNTVASLLDRLDQRLAGRQKVKVQQVQPIQRPENAIDRVRQQEHVRAHHRVVSRVEAARQRRRKRRQAV